SLLDRRWLGGCWRGCGLTRSPTVLEEVTPFDADGLRRVEVALVHLLDQPLVASGSGDLVGFRHACHRVYWSAFPLAGRPRPTSLSRAWCPPPNPDRGIRRLRPPSRVDRVDLSRPVHRNRRPAPHQPPRRWRDDGRS